MKRLLLLLILFSQLEALTWEASESNKFYARVELVPEELTPDGVITLTLSLRYPIGYSVDLEELRENLLDTRIGRGPTVRLVDEEATPALSSGEGLRSQEITYILEPWSLGTINLSLYDINFYPESGRSVTLFSDLFSIRVAKEFSEHSPGQLQMFLPIQASPILQLSQENRRNLIDRQLNGPDAAKRALEQFQARQFPWHWLWITGATLLIFFIARRIWLRRGRATGEGPVIDPKEKALEALRELRSMKLPEQGQFEPFYVSLTDIVREYIEGRYDIHAPEQTTEEFLQEITQNSAFESETKGVLGEFLLAADMVKFAKHAPTMDDCKDAEKAACDFVEAE